MRPRISPNAPNIAPINQNRIVMVASFHPRCSKWWWSGAIENIFRLKNFFEKSCAMTERVSTTKIMPIIGKIATEFVSMAITPSVAPIAREPVSPR